MNRNNQLLKLFYFIDMLAYVYFYDNIVDSLYGDVILLNSNLSYFYIFC